MQAVLLSEAEVLGLDGLQASLALGARVTTSLTVLAREELVELVLDGWVKQGQGKRRRVPRKAQ